VKTLIKQLILLVIATAILTSFFYSIGINLVIAVLTSFFLQVACYNAFIYIVNTFTSLRLRRLEIEKIKELTYQALEVSCPCNSKHRQIVPVRLNTENIYTCNTCQKRIKIFITADTAMVTDPILQPDTQNVLIAAKNVT